MLNKNTIYLLLFIGLFFLIILESFLSLIFVVFIISYFIKPNKISNILFVACMASIIALVNSIRFPTHDGINYINDYLGLMTTSFAHKTDIGFYLVNNIIYSISNGNEQFFMFFWSFVFYFNMILSLYILYKSKILSYKAFILSSLIFIASPMYMVMSTHLIRQFVSESFFALSLALYVTSNKKYYISLIFMVLTHFASLIFLPFFLYKKIRYRLSIATLLVMVLLTITVGNVNIFILLNDVINIISVDLGVYSSMIESAAKVHDDDGNVSHRVYVLSIISILYLFYLVYYKKKYRYVFIFNLLLISFLIFNALVSVQLLWLRFSFYQYIFYPIVFGIMITNIYDRYIKIFSFLLILLYGLKFIFFFENMNWVHENKKEQLFDKGVTYFLNVKK